MKLWEVIDIDKTNPNNIKQKNRLSLYNEGENNACAVDFLMWVQKMMQKRPLLGGAGNWLTFFRITGWMAKHIFDSFIFLIVILYQ